MVANVVIGKDFTSTFIIDKSFKFYLSIRRYVRSTYYLLTLVRNECAMPASVRRHACLLDLGARPEVRGAGIEVPLPT